MIRNIQTKNFKAVPYLETSLLMLSHPDGIVFSTDKPNVIVGPNGAGKSALLTALSFLTLSSQTGISTFDRSYLHSLDNEDLWKDGKYRCDPPIFLPGLVAETDNAPALYYRPHHIPGNWEMITAAMMSGYSDEAREYGLQTRHKSSGQQCSALLARVVSALRGDTALLKQHVPKDWAPKPALSADDAAKYREVTKLDALRNRFDGLPEHIVPTLILDEPEQSLDARMELELWRLIEAVETSAVQVIVATHSLYPMLHPGKFNLIEAEPGYIKAVVSLL